MDERRRREQAPALQRADGRLGRDKTPHPPLTRSPLLPSRRRIVKCYRLRPLGSAFSLLWATPFDKNNYQLFLSALTTGEGKRADGRAVERGMCLGPSRRRSLQYADGRWVEKAPSGRGLPTESGGGERDKGKGANMQHAGLCPAGSFRHASRATFLPEEGNHADGRV